MELGWKSGWWPPALSSPGNILPLHLYARHNQFAKETGWQLLTCLPTLPLRVFLCLNKLSLYFLSFFFFHFTFLTSLHCLWIPLTRSSIHWEYHHCYQLRWIDRPLVVSTTNWHLPKLVPVTGQQGFAIYSVETELCSCSCWPSAPLRRFRVSETLCDPGDNGGAGLRQLDIFLGKDFMIPIPASSHI